MIVLTPYFSLLGSFIYPLADDEIAFKNLSICNFHSYNVYVYGVLNPIFNLVYDV